MGWFTEFEQKCNILEIFYYFQYFEWSVSGQVFLMQLTDKIVLTSPHAHIMLILKRNHNQ